MMWPPRAGGASADRTLPVPERAAEFTVAMGTAAAYSRAVRQGVHVHAAVETFACDANGNVSDYVGTGGASVAHYEYDPFGNALSAGGPLSATFPHRFSTKYLDAETGLYYYGYRFYSPELGRWLSGDPIGGRGGLNVYVYVHNGPVNRVDPLGLWEWPWTGCCEGKSYNKITHCCRKDVVWSRFITIATGVKKCTAQAQSYGLVEHAWLETPSGAIDVVADASAFASGILGSTGIIGNAAGYVGGTKKCTEVKIPPCIIDKDKFLSELASLMGSYQSGATTWWSLPSHSLKNEVGLNPETCHKAGYEKEPKTQPNGLRL